MQLVMSLGHSLARQTNLPNATAADTSLYPSVEKQSRTGGGYVEKPAEPLCSECLTPNQEDMRLNPRLGAVTKDKKTLRVRSCHIVYVFGKLDLFSQRVGWQLVIGGLLYFRFFVGLDHGEKARKGGKSCF